MLGLTAAYEKTTESSISGFDTFCARIGQER